MADSDRLPTWVMVMTVVLVLNLIASGVLFYLLMDTRASVSEIEETQTDITDLLVSPPTNGGELSSATAVNATTQNGVMLAYDPNTGGGKLIPYEYRPLPSDKIYIETSDLNLGRSTQRSFDKAQRAVEQSDEYTPAMSGMVISTNGSYSWEYLQGESASLSVARQIAATDPAYRLNKSVVVTGELTENGQVNRVDKVTQKAEAAEEAGFDVLVAPPTFGPVQVEGINVVHVRTLEDALDWGLDDA